MPSDPLNLIDDNKKLTHYVPKGAVKVLPQYFELG